MTPALIVQAILAGIQAAPQIESLAVDGKNYIMGLFKAGLIDVATQTAAFAYCDAVTAAAKAGVIPLAAQVQPDPA